MPSKCRRLRELIEAPELLILPGVFDGYSARLVKQFGYEAAFVSGSAVSETRLGQPDVGLLHLDENVAAARAISACSDLILLADADTGYGNALNVYHTLRAFERAGAHGIMLEDQVAPKRCGHMKGKEVISAEEMVEKIHAAVEAKEDPDFVIKARTDVLATHDVKEAIRRLNMYREAGATLLFPDAAMSREDISAVVKNVNGPVAVNMGFGIRKRSTTPLISPAELQEMGVAEVIYARFLPGCALAGMRQGLQLLQQSIDTGKVVDRPDVSFSFEEIQETLGMEAIHKLEQRFLTPEQKERKYGKGGAVEVVPGLAKTH